MKTILILSATFLCALCQRAELIRPGLPGIICPMFKLAAPKPGCHYEYVKDRRGCDIPNEVCTSGPFIPEPEEGVACPVYDLMPPKEGCHYEEIIGEDGCPRPVERCTNEPKEGVICPVYSMLPPKEGCHYENTIDERGCPKPKEVCDGEPKECGPNEELTQCGSSCPETCEQYRTGIYPSCIMSCQVNVCQCKAGYARDANKRCVRKEECPAVTPTKCGPNEEMKECGSACGSVTCEQYTTGVYPLCPAMCQLNQCQCKDGYAKDANGRCIRQEECPVSSEPRPPVLPPVLPPPGEPKCGAFEELKECGSACERTCKQVRDGIMVSCIEMCIPNVCQCLPGYARDENGRCVLERECKANVPKCGRNEELKECGTMCPLTCEQIATNEFPPCPEMCQVNVCQCKDGYALDANKRCVRKEFCPRANRRISPRFEVPRRG